MKRNTIKLISGIFFILLFSFTNRLSASQHFSSNDSHFNHLSEINKEWNNHTDICPDGNISFNSDEDRIQLHLKLVCKFLLNNTPTNLTTQQKNNRLKLIQALGLYAEKKVFPINKYHQERQPYFVDEIGTHCAVGQLIAVSGNEKLVSKISDEHNYDYIVDIKTEGLLEWANENGFMLDELKWIQPGYAPNTVVSPVGNGTNGTINEVKYDGYEDRIFISGEFTELNDLPCLNIGYFKDEQLSCLGDGIDGVVHNVISNSDGVFVFGIFNNGFTTHPAAFFDGTDWFYLSIPTREDAVCTAVTLGGWGYIAEVAISHGSIPNEQEIWFLTSGLNWEKKAKVNGIVMEADFSSHGRIFVGHFDTLTVYTSTGLVDTSFAVTNIAIRENWGSEWYALNGDVSDTLKTVQEIGGALYFGGTCSSNPGISNVCLTRYYNDVFQPLYLKETYMGTDDFSINTITYKSGSSIVIGGNFIMEPMGVGTYGSNLALFNLISNSLDPQAILDASVNSVAYMGNTLYIGGDFNTNMTTTQLNHIGRINYYTDITEAFDNDNIKVFPNPVQNEINFSGIEIENSEIHIYSLDGKEIMRRENISENKIDVSELATGSYILKLITEAGVYSVQIFKE